MDKRNIKKLDEKEAIKGLKLLIKMFEENNVDYWIDCGNLLGAIREKRFIPWDTDIDICVRFSNNKIPNIFVKTLEKKGFNVGMTKHRWIGMEKKGYPHMDIDLFKLPEGTIVLSMLCYYLPTFMRLKTIKLMQKFYSTNDAIRPVENEERDKSKICKITRLLLPIFFCGKLKKIRFYDMHVSVPEKAEELLIMRYGKDWKTPKEIFDAYTA